jgi:hypothetical protein
MTERYLIGAKILIRRQQVTREPAGGKACPGRTVIPLNKVAAVVAAN